MIPAFSPFLALRYLVTRRINLLSVFGVAFAVWAMLVVDGVFTGFVSDIRSNVRRSAPPLLLTQLPHDTGYRELADVLEADPQVVATAPRLRHFGIVQPVLSRSEVRRGSAQATRSSQLEFDHTENGFALLLGIDPLLEPKVVDLQGWLDRGADELNSKIIGTLPTSEVLREPDPERRSMLRVPDDAEWHARGDAGLDRPDDPAEWRSIWPGVVLGWWRARHVRLPPIGTRYDLLIASFPTVDDDGNAKLRTHSMPAAFAGFFATGNRTFDETTVLLPIEALRTALGQDISDPYGIDLCTDVAIRPVDGLSATALTALKRRLEAAVQPKLPDGSPPCAVLDWQEQNVVFLSAVAQEQAMMQIVLFVVMLVSAFVIYTTLHMMVVQKVKDIGIVTAVGGAPRGIGQVFVLSGLVVALVGTALGVGAGLLSAELINPINDWVYELSDGRLELFPRGLFDLDQVPCDLQGSWIATVAIGAVLLSVLVAYVPARRAARLNPVTALSFE